MQMIFGMHYLLQVDFSQDQTCCYRLWMYKPVDDLTLFPFLSIVAFVRAEYIAKLH